MRKEQFVDPSPPVHHRPVPPVHMPSAADTGRAEPTQRFGDDHQPLSGGAWDDRSTPASSTSRDALAPPGSAAYRGREIHAKPHAPAPPPTPLIEIEPLRSTAQADFTPKPFDHSPRKYTMLSESQPPVHEKFEAESTLHASFPAYPADDYKVKPVPSPRR
jgi:hypothetical protein